MSSSQILHRTQQALDGLFEQASVEALDDGRIVLRLMASSNGPRFERIFRDERELDTFGVDVIMGLLREALEHLFVRRSHTTAPGMSLEENLEILGRMSGDVEIVSTDSFMISDYPLLNVSPKPVGSKSATHEDVTRIQTRDEAPSKRPRRARDAQATTQLDSAELHRRLHGTPADGWVLPNQEAQRATLSSNNMSTASLIGSDTANMSDAAQTALISCGYPATLAFEVAPGRISIQLTRGLRAVIVEESELKKDMMNVLARLIEDARRHGVLPRRS